MQEGWTRARFMGLHKQLQLPGFCMCIVKRRSYRTCLEMLGVKCVCPETAAEIHWTFVSPPHPSILIVPPAWTDISDKQQKEQHCIYAQFCCSKWETRTGVWVHLGKDVCLKATTVTLRKAFCVYDWVIKLFFLWKQTGKTATMFPIEMKKFFKWSFQKCWEPKPWNNSTE